MALTTVLMSSPVKKRVHSARADLMVVVGSALYFLILLLALYVMDRQVYTAAKLEIIRDNFLEIFHPPDTLNEQARRVLYSASPVVQQAETEKLKESLTDIVQGPTSMYSMRLVDAEGHVLIDAVNQDKPAALNTWENNLFIREFSGRTSQNVSPFRYQSDTTTTMAGHLTGTYTSPVDVPAITSLTQRYRMYAVLFTIGWGLAWLAIYYYLLRPVRNVTLHLDRSRDGVPSLIPAARGALERGYNDLAASALLQMVEEKLNAAARPGQGHGAGERSAVIEEALALAGDAFGASRLRVGLLGSSDQDYAVTESHEWSRSGSSSQGVFPALVCPIKQDETHLVNYPDGSGFTRHAPLATGCMQADCRYADGRPPSPEFHHYLVRACDVLQGGFVAFQAYREQLFRERSEANISLSRNMGHDLTNIIATSKLELMGIKSILTGVTPGTTLSEPRAAILSQSVAGLLESTRFMQEMVNIYRSFSYVKRPAYERRPLEPLIREFVKMFEPALSSHVRIELELAPDMQAPIVEPRLLKLALFNVLQNALDAIKRMPETEAGSGIITVSAAQMADDSQYQIAVRDNGPGIRDAHGHLLSPKETQGIFEYGYSTKGESGEGLGLNWVQTIMTDFHDGGARAENMPAGGTQIILWLRSMDRKEARVGNGRNGSATGFGDALPAVVQ